MILGVGQSTTGGQRKSKCVAKFGKSPCFGVKVHIKIPTLADTFVSNKGRYYGAGDRTRFAFLPLRGTGKNYCSHQFLNWWQQVSTGHLHLDGFESRSRRKKADTPTGYLLFGAGDRTRTGTLSPAVDFESVGLFGIQWNVVEPSGIFHLTKHTQPVVFAPKKLHFSAKQPQSKRF